MIMFVSGEGGTGKSTLINSVTLYAQIHAGKTEGTWGPVLKTAPTGGAAFNIGGSTWHSALGKSSAATALRLKDAIPDGTIVALQRKAKGTVLFVLDELSLVNCEDLHEISRRLQAATGNLTQPFGGLHVLLAGDFYQMKTISGTPLVTDITSNHSAEARFGRAIMTDQLTDFCLLIHNVRAQQGTGVLTPLAEFTRKARRGDVHDGVLHLLNDRVVNNVQVAMRAAHPHALWITSTHRKVATINDLFRKRREENNEHMVTIIAHHIPAEPRTPAADDPNILDELYREGGSRKGGSTEMMISYMVLFVGSRVRVIRNLFVEGGLYNGAMGTVWGFVYAGKGPQTSTTKHFSEMTQAEREIPIVLVQMDGDEATFPYSCVVGVPRIIPMVAVQSQRGVDVQVEMDDHSVRRFKYNRLQLPILPAEARTAHSVQGYTAKDGVVVDPGSNFFAGDYTAISRATCKEKVFLLAPLQENYFTRMASYRHLVDSEYERLITAFPQ
jgi:hypothetical protein